MRPDDDLPRLSWNMVSNVVTINDVPLRSNAEGARATFDTLSKMREELFELRRWADSMWHHYGQAPSQPSRRLP